MARACGGDQGAAGIFTALHADQPKCSLASRAMIRPASAVLPIPPIPVSATPLAAPNRRTAVGSRRSTRIAVRSRARRPISTPTGSLCTDPAAPPTCVATVRAALLEPQDRSEARHPPGGAAASPPHTPASRRPILGPLATFLGLPRPGLEPALCRPAGPQLLIQAPGLQRVAYPSVTGESIAHHPVRAPLDEPGRHRPRGAHPPQHGRQHDQRHRPAPYAAVRPSNPPAVTGTGLPSSSSSSTEVADRVLTGAARGTHPVPAPGGSAASEATSTIRTPTCRFIVRADGIQHRLHLRFSVEPHVRCLLSGAPTAANTFSGPACPACPACAGPTSPGATTSPTAAACSVTR